MAETKHDATTATWKWSTARDACALSQRRPLAVAAAELETLWRDHVTRAEGRGGLHAFLCAARPGYLPVVRHLRSEQRALLADLEALRSAAQRTSTRSSWLRAEYGRLARAVIEHDELETELLCDVIERG